MARWNTAYWDIDRWSTLSTADLFNSPPSTNSGHLIGVDDWKISVEMLLPTEPTGLWGIGTWNNSEWNVYSWQDITNHVRGLEWTRGSDEYLGRPRIGQGVITLDNTNDKWSSWNPTPPIGGPNYFGPGTVVRIGVTSATGGWLPQFTGIVDTWSATYVGAGADKFIDVTLFETARDLASVDENSVGSPVGGGETADLRLTRLLEAANWPYGYVLDAENTDGYTLQSTDMAANRLTELYQTTDSSNSRFYTNRKGQAYVESAWTNTVFEADNWPLMSYSYDNAATPNTPAVIINGQHSNKVGTIQSIAYDADSFATVNEDSHIVNDARFSRVGGTQQVWEQGASIARYGRRTLARSDFLNTTDLAVEGLAYLYTYYRSRNSLRIQALEVATSDRGDDAFLAMLALDIYCKAVIQPPDYVSSIDPYANGFIENFTHRVTPLQQGVIWRTTIGVGILEVVNLPAAQLPDNSYS